MKRRAPLWLLSLLILAGCYPMSRNSVEEEKDPHFVEGSRRRNAMDDEGAIKSFERALQSNPNNSAAHFELGILYEKKGDCIAALYHYERHLQLRENSPNGEMVTNRMVNCKRELASTVSYTVVNRDVQRQFEKLTQTNAALKQRVDQLELELTRRPQFLTNYVTNFVSIPQFSPTDRNPTRATQIVRTEVGESEPAPSVNPRIEQKKSSTPKSTSSRPTTKRETPPAATAAASSHTVRPGETLAVIAQKYGISKEELISANPGIARGTRAGQKLNIPAQ